MQRQKKLMVALCRYNSAHDIRQNVFVIKTQRETIIPIRKFIFEKKDEDIYILYSYYS